MASTSMNDLDNGDINQRIEVITSRHLGALELSSGLLRQIRVQMGGTPEGRDCLRLFELVRQMDFGARSRYLSQLGDDALSAGLVRDYDWAYNVGARYLVVTVVNTLTAHGQNQELAWALVQEILEPVWQVSPPPVAPIPGPAPTPLRRSARLQHFRRPPPPPPPTSTPAVVRPEEVEAEAEEEGGEEQEQEAVKEVEEVEEAEAVDPFRRYYCHICGRGRVRHRDLKRHWREKHPGANQGTLRAQLAQDESSGAPWTEDEARALGRDWATMNPQ